MLRRDGGFTLIEVVIAFGILAALVATAYSALSGILRSKRYLDDNRDAQAIAAPLLTRLARELQLADADSRLLPEQNQPDTWYPEKVCLLGEDRSFDGGTQADRISFMARGAAQHIIGSGSKSNLVKITYHVEKERGNGGEPAVYLVRDETPSVKPVERALEQTVTFPLTDRLTGLRFRYFSGEDDKWLDEWGKDKYTGLPEMIEISLGISSPLGKMHFFKTAVPLRSSQLED